MTTSDTRDVGDGQVKATDVKRETKAWTQKNSKVENENFQHQPKEWWHERERESDISSVKMRQNFNETLEVGYI